MLAWLKTRDAVGRSVVLANLSDCHIDDDAFAVLAASISKTPLRALDLDRTGIDDKRASLLSDRLKANRTGPLRVLSALGNPFSDDVGRQLLDAAKEHKTLACVRTSFGLSLPVQSRTEINREWRARNDEFVRQGKNGPLFRRLNLAAVCRNRVHRIQLGRPCRQLRGDGCLCFCGEGHRIGSSD